MIKYMVAQSYLYKTIWKLAPMHHLCNLSSPINNKFDGKVGASFYPTRYLCQLTLFFVLGLFSIIRYLCQLWIVLFVYLFLSFLFIIIYYYYYLLLPLLHCILKNIHFNLTRLCTCFYETWREYFICIFIQHKYFIFIL